MHTVLYALLSGRTASLAKFIRKRSAFFCCDCDVKEMIAYVFFFFNATATTEIYTLSLPDALPISSYFFA